MESYVLKQISGAPDWEEIEALPIANLQWSAPIDCRAQAQLCWNKDAIHVRLRAQETNIRAEHFGRPCMVCEDSCLEFFFRPYSDDLRYFNFEFNPNCALYLGFGTGMPDLIRLFVADEQALFVPAARRLEDGWEITYQIPFRFVRQFFPDFLPAKNLAFRGNCYKCGDLTVQPHYLSWSPLSCDTPGFHRPQDFGELIFG